MSIAKKEKKGAKKEESEGIKPTRAIAAYIFYSNEQVPKIKAAEGISHKEAMGKAGKKWHELTEEEKKPYNKMHDDDVVR